MQYKDSVNCGRMCLLSARGGRMRSPLRGMTRGRCGLLPNYITLLLQLQYWRVDEPRDVRSTDVITGSPVDLCPPARNVFPEQLRRRRRSPVHGAVDNLWPHSTIRAGVLVLNQGNAGELSDTIDFKTPEAGRYLSLLIPPSSTYTLRGGSAVGCLDLRFTGRGFNFRPVAFT